MQFRYMTPNTKLVTRQVSHLWSRPPPVTFINTASTGTDSENTKFLMFALFLTCPQLMAGSLALKIYADANGDLLDNRIIWICSSFSNALILI